MADAQKQVQADQEYEGENLSVNCEIHLFSHFSSILSCFGIAFLTIEILGNIYGLLGKVSNISKYVTKFNF